MNKEMRHSKILHFLAKMAAVIHSCLGTISCRGLVNHLF